MQHDTSFLVLENQFVMGKTLTRNKSKTYKKQNGKITGVVLGVSQVSLWWDKILDTNTLRGQVYIFFHHFRVLKLWLLDHVYLGRIFPNLWKFKVVKKKFYISQQMGTEINIHPRTCSKNIFPPAKSYHPNTQTFNIAIPHK